MLWMLLQLWKSLSDLRNLGFQRISFIQHQRGRARSTPGFCGTGLPEYTGPEGFIRVRCSFPRPDQAPRSRDEGEETAGDDFAAELLRAMGYETEDTVVRTRKNIRLTMPTETSASW